MAIAGSERGVMASKPRLRSPSIGGTDTRSLFDSQFWLRCPPGSWPMAWVPRGEPSPLTLPVF